MDWMDEIVRLQAQIEQLRAKIESLEARTEEGEGMDDVFLRMETGGGSGGADYGAFRWEDGKITNCRFMFGREVITLDDVQNATADGRWSLLIPHAAPENASVLLNASQSTDLTQTVVPLFRVSNGEIVADWRGMPVIPVRE